MRFSCKAIIFDWAYTLVDLAGQDDREAFVRMFDLLRAKRIHAPEPQECYRFAWELFRPMIQQSRKTHQEACFEHVLNDLLFYYSIDLENKVTVNELLTAYYQKIYSTRKIYPDVLPALERFKEAGVRMGIISNTTNPGFAKRYEKKALGLDPFFEFAIYSSEVPYRKPHPSIFELGIARLGVNPTDILFVGDNLLQDVSGAQGVGMLAAWINREGEPLPPEYSPDYEIKTLESLLTLDPIKV